jgi:NAD(P)H-dependent flavin oxidoreductase YrpB (nitropropane dioxygenase family)
MTATIITALTIILGLPDGRPAQVIEREWSAEWTTVSTSREAECDAARMIVLRAIQGIMEKNPAFVVSIRCTAERKL